MIKLMLSYSEIISASLALVLAAPATAMAAPPAAWVSGQGTNEAGCGSQQSPCATFQYVHDNILGPDGGDIVVLGAGVYGAGTLNITKPLSILNDSAGTAAVGAGSGPAISINVPNGGVYLRGLTIDGLGLGQDGVSLSNASKLTITNCVIRNFTHDGIYLQPQGVLNFSAINVIASDNGNNGFDLSPHGSGGIMGFIDHSSAFNNGADGVAIWGANTSANPGNAITINSSNTSNNKGYGVYLYSSSTSPFNTGATIRNTISDNNGVGYYVGDYTIVYFSKSEADYSFSSHSVQIVGNALAYSYGDNSFGPSVSVSGSLKAVPPQ
jgi:hypothetical protein